MRAIAAVALTLATPAFGQGAAELPALMRPQAVGALPAGKPTEVIRYGDAPSQFVELWLPEAAAAGEGLYPTVALIHGGCWRKEVAGIELVRPMATDLAKRGYAVWAIAYRRIDEEGGGYPGTYADVAAAMDKLAAEAPARRLDLSRLATMGHSAGGHLALWAAMRDRLPAGHPLRPGTAIPPKLAVSLGGLADLKNWADQVDGVCGAGTVKALTGEAGEGRADVFRDTSPAQMLPTGVPVLMVQGIYDAVSYPAVGRAFARQAQQAGTPAGVALIPNAGHFEVIAPGTAAWNSIANTLAERLPPKR